MVGKYKAVWNRQGGKCYYCNKPILLDQQRDIIPIDITRVPTTANIAYIHSFCKEDELIYKTITNEDELLHSEDIMSLLYRLKADNPKEYEHKPFERLQEYFLNLELSPHSLSFEEIEHIMETTLCASAYKYSSYWHNKNRGSIADCWLKNGYVIQRLHLDKKYIVFRKENMNISKLTIPTVFLTNKIPIDAKYEIENYLEFIRKKYGL